MNKKHILTLLQQRRVAEAIHELRECCSAGCFAIADRLGEVEESYKFMLRYLAEGVNDPKRDEIFADIISRLASLAERAEMETEVQTSPRLYYATIRMRRMSPLTLEASLRRCGETTAMLAAFYEADEGDRTLEQECRLLQNKERAEQDVFKYVWTQYPLTHGDIELLIDSIVADSTSSLSELIVASLGLNLTEHYSEPALTALMDLYLSEKVSDVLSVKALVWVLMALCRYRQIASGSNVLKLRFDALADNPRGKKDVLMIYRQVILSKSTEKINRKVRDELVPKLMKLNPEIRRKMRSIDISDPEEFAANPEWQEMFEKSGISDKMMELSKMQAEGSDVFLSTFSHLKTYPFFREVSNWFMPFTMRQSDVCGAVTKGDIAMLSSLFDNNRVFCDSDKYSFVLSVSGIAAAQRNMMMGQLEGQAEQVEMQSQTQIDMDAENEMIVNKYLQNLYRFFTLFRNKTEFHNPFADRLMLTEAPFVGSLISTADDLRRISTAYFSQENYEDALLTFARLESVEALTPGELQRVGYCREAMKHYEKAIETYKKVELYNSDDVWTLKHIASSLRRLGRYEEAIDYYRSVEKLQPENEALANNLASCLLEAGHTEEALKYYFKVDYLACKGTRTLRAIGWCSLLVGNFAQSEDYYTRAISIDNDAEDYVNRGHARLCSGKVNEAVTDYAAAVRLSTLDRVIDTIQKDNPYLLKAGVDSTLLGLLLDKLRYDNTENQ